LDRIERIPPITHYRFRKIELRLERGEAVVQNVVLHIKIS
jgi:hypothetical protein